MGDAEAIEAEELPPGKALNTMPLAVGWARAIQKDHAGKDVHLNPAWLIGLSDDVKALQADLRRAQGEASAAGRLVAAVADYIGDHGPCVDAEEMCVLCHAEGCSYCALLLALGYAKCTDDCGHEPSEAGKA